MEILICGIFWNTVSCWKIISILQKIFMCYKTPTKGSINFSSYPLPWPIFGLFCHKVSFTCTATHNLLPRYVSLTFVHFISGTKRMLSLGRSSTCRTLLCLHRFLTNLTWDSDWDTLNKSVTCKYLSPVSKHLSAKEWQSIFQSHFSCKNESRKCQKPEYIWIHLFMTVSTLPHVILLYMDSICHLNHLLWKPHDKLGLT